ncbi:MAG: ABC transporter substrate-binding protein [Desulfarculaceae bacterium]|nr:ABC transporter substrate-binding protein [Desulfarculaceae bacterium]MCF8073219.1 ABC transporter substrate-binding protein [Desulfarculaceae bacterium]MCF8100815.1 ABC transporter substrate-binding protein [Desulfarculaceae bacterium]MCF8117747.1 ABC transporter substrate-binding protein [Desulfarculaceae bacterium]
MKGSRTITGREGRCPLLALALLLALACLAACAADEAGDQAGPSLVIGIGRELYNGPDDRTYLHGSTHTWEALTYLDQHLRPRPWLARSWTSSDHGRVWDFYLRPGVRYHDGTPFTARDAVFCIERIRHSPKYDPVDSYRSVRKVEALGPLHLRFTLSRPCPFFPALVSQYHSPIIKPGVVDQAGRITRLVGTGPYRLQEVRPGYEIRLEAFDGYWGRKPAFKRVTFRLLLDAQTRAMALMAGDVDAVADVGAILPEQVPDLERAPGITLKSREVATTHYLTFNCRRNPFSSREARRWLLGQIGRQDLVARMAGRIAIPAHDSYTRLAADYAYGLLNTPAQAGSPPQPTESPLVILLHGGTVQRWPYLDLAQAIQQLLVRSGLPTQIRVAEAGAFYQALKKGQYDLVLSPNTLMTGDPDFFYTYYLASGAPANPGWHDAEVDQLIAQARQEMDPARRREMLMRLEKIVNREAPLWPLFHEKALYAHGPRLAEFDMDYFFRPELLSARPAALESKP